MAKREWRDRNTMMVTWWQISANCSCKECSSSPQSSTIVFSVHRADQWAVNFHRAFSCLALFLLCESESPLAIARCNIKNLKTFVICLICSRTCSSLNEPLLLSPSLLLSCRLCHFTPIPTSVTHISWVEISRQGYSSAVGTTGGAHNESRSASKSTASFTSSPSARVSG